MRKFRFTAATIHKFSNEPVNGTAQIVTYDTGQPGLGAYVGKTGVGSYFVHYRVNGRQKKFTLGRLTELSVNDARSKTAEIRIAAREGRDLIDERKKKAERSIPLSQAYTEYLLALHRKQASPRTIDLVERLWKIYLKKHENAPLVSFTKQDVRSWHKSWGHRGPSAANHAARLLRTIYNYAHKLSDGLPSNPCVGIEYFSERNKRPILHWGDLPNWWEKVEGLENPTRKNYWKILLYTGLRATDCASIKWPDLTNNVLYRPKPKGGKNRAFEIPITRQTQLIFEQQKKLIRKLSPGTTYVFPATSRSGHLSNTREKTFLEVTPHVLRRTFATACIEAGVDPYTTKLLLNHKPDAGSDITALYVKPSREHILSASQKVADFLDIKLAQKPEGKIIHKHYDPRQAA